MIIDLKPFDACKRLKANRIELAATAFLAAEISYRGVRHLTEHDVTLCVTLARSLISTMDEEISTNE